MNNMQAIINQSSGRRLLSAAGLLGALCASPGLARAADPPPPIAVNAAGATSHYTPTEASFGDQGYALMQIWSYAFDASDGRYVVAEARVNLTPTSGDDIEEFHFSLDNPGRSKDVCRLIQWLPRRNGRGVTFSAGASINTSGAVGISVGVGGLALGNEDVEIEDAGPSPDQDAEWDVDFDDFSDTAASSTTLDFYALWRCTGPDAQRVGLHGAYWYSPGAYLDFEIDDWGPNSQFWLPMGGELETRGDDGWEKVAQQSLGEDAMAALVDRTDTMMVDAGQRMRVRARVTGYPSSLAEVVPEAVAATARIGDAAPVALALSKVGGGDYPYFELTGWIDVPAGVASVTPQVDVSFYGEPAATAVGATLPVIRDLRGDQTLSIAPGATAVRLLGTPGAPFDLQLTGDGLWVDGAIQDGPSAPLRAVAIGPTMTGVYTAEGPVVVIHNGGQAAARLAVAAHAGPCDDPPATDSPSGGGGCAAGGQGAGSALALAMVGLLLVRRRRRG